MIQLAKRDEKRLSLQFVWRIGLQRPFPFCRNKLIKQIWVTQFFFVWTHLFVYLLYFSYILSNVFPTCPYPKFWKNCIFACLYYVMSVSLHICIPLCPCHVSVLLGSLQVVVNSAYLNHESIQWKCESETPPITSLFTFVSRYEPSFCFCAVHF